MAIPKFYGAFLKRKAYPGVLIQGLPIISTLSIDLNTLIHLCAQINYSYQDYSKDFLRINYIKKHTPEQIELELFKAIGNAILEIVSECQPRDALVIAVDGVAPMGKMQQQRQRRYMSKSGEFFDSNSITPGTPFMVRLDEFLGEWVKSAKYTLPPNVIYSGHLQEGEGEHKIFEYYRENKNNLFDDRKMHVIYGLDADLIMLSLLSPLSNIYLFRKDINDIVSIANLRTGIKSDLQTDSAIEDFVLMTYLLGNDFLPHYPEANNFYDLIAKMFESYRKVNKSLCKEGDIDYSALGDFLDVFAAYEPGLLEFAVRHVPEKWEKNVPPKGALFKMFDDIPFDYPTFRSAWYINELRPKGDPSEINETFKVFGLAPELKDVNSNEIILMAEYFLVCMQWNLKYYLKGSKGINTKFYYPYNQCVLIKDLAEVVKYYPLRLYKCLPNETRRFTVLHQLLIVIPPRSTNILPEVLHEYHDVSSQILEYYPETFVYDEVSRHAILPNIDPIRILSFDFTSEVGKYVDNSKTLVQINIDDRVQNDLKEQLRKIVASESKSRYYPRGEGSKYKPSPKKPEKETSFKPPILTPSGGFARRTTRMEKQVVDIVTEEKKAPEVKIPEVKPQAIKIPKVKSTVSIPVKTVQRKEREYMKPQRFEPQKKYIPKAKKPPQAPPQRQDWNALEEVM